MTGAVADDLRFAIRYLRRRPVFAATVAVTLAIAIASTTTAFGLATAVLWRPLPFDDASRLVFVWEAPTLDGQRAPSRVTGSRYAEWRDTSSSFASIAAFGAAGFTVDNASGATFIRGVRVSAGFFDTLGIRPALGRAFTPSDEGPGAEPVVILSHGLWQERFGGRREVLGESLRLSGQPHLIVGVMPAVVFPAWPVNPALVTLDPDSRQLWVPIPRTPQLDQSSRAHVFGVVARLSPGIGSAQAQDELTRGASPTAPDPHAAQVTPLREQFVRDARTPLLTLAAAALAVLLIACANLAALYVSAFEARRGELALRAAIGAGLWRLVRQLTVEALLLAIWGGIAGTLLARVALTWLPARLPPTIPFLTTPRLDLQVAGFAILLSILATVVLTAWPVARLILAAPAPRGVSAGPRGLVYRGLVVSQIAVTTALAIAAGLLGQSLQSVYERDPGFAVDHAFVADVDLPAVSPPSARLVAATEQRVLARLRSLPGVRSVAAAYDHPLEANWSETFTVVGDVRARDHGQPGELRIVSPGYVDALDLDLVDGRALTERDNLDAPGAVLINEAFARAIGGRALGRRIRTGTPRFLYGDAAPDEFEVVGVVRNERSRGLEEAVAPALYLSTRQFPQQAFSVIVRTIGDPLAIAGDVRTALHAVDPAITLSRPTTVEALLTDLLAARRVTTSVVGAFAAAALALAGLGMYGLLAVLVASRVREVGVRVALGASPALIARAVVGDSLRTTAMGLVAGAVLAVISTRLIASLLVDVRAEDPITLGGVAMILLLLASTAALGPARRAARTDPAGILRAP